MNRLYILAAIVIFVGCTSEILPPDNGPCVHEYRDPVLKIEHVTSVMRNESIDQIILNSISIDNNSLPLTYYSGSPLKNISFQNTSMVCTVPCGFGIDSGTYEFKVSAEGYLDSTVTVTAHYDIFEGGCPSYNDNGTEISIGLRPE